MATSKPRGRTISLSSPGNSPRLSRRSYRPRIRGGSVSGDERQRLISDMMRSKSNEPPEKGGENVKDEVLVKKDH